MVIRNTRFRSNLINWSGFVNNKFVVLLYYFILLSILGSNLLLSVHFLQHYESSKPIVYYVQESHDDISCHDEPEHVLATTGDWRFAPTDKSIYFIETSCKGGFNSRQACSIESAARAHPHWQIYVLTAGPLHRHTIKREPLKTLQTMMNVDFVRITSKTFNKPSLKWIFQKEGIETSPYKVSHTSDVLRLLTLNKYGGIYLDFDMIVVKPLDSLPKNFVAKLNNDDVTSWILAFTKYGVGKEFSETAIIDLSKSYNPEDWGYNGPALMLRTLDQICDLPALELMSDKICEGFHVLHEKYFYPISHAEGSRYFGSETMNIKEEFTHRIWNNLSHTHRIAKESLYGQLAAKFCPQVYELYQEDFGL